MSIQQAMFAVLVVSLMERVEGLTIEQAAVAADVAMELLGSEK